MTDPSPATGKALALSFLRGIGPAALRDLVALPGFETDPVERLATKSQKLAKALDADGAWSAALMEAEKQLDLADAAGARILSPVDREYPALLAATKDDPFILFVKGTLAAEAAKSVAVIGTREPTAHGKLIAERITQFFVERSWSIVSGLALGCDAIAHQAAIDAGGHTVAVLAHGLQTIAPTRHKKLADEIVGSGGALVSQYPFGQDAMPMLFVQRDKTQAAMAQGVVMVQSDLKGGSLHASRAALSYGRWLAVPYPTPQDLGRSEPKIQANLAIADGSARDSGELLRCKDDALRRVIVLRGREDYEKMIGAAPAAPVQRDPTQAGLI